MAFARKLKLSFVFIVFLAKNVSCLNFSLYFEQTTTPVLGADGRATNAGGNKHHWCCGNFLHAQGKKTTQCCLQVRLMLFSTETTWQANVSLSR